MASPSNPEANEIRRRGRQRLIGAVVLVALLVVFVPMLLDSEPRPKPSSPDSTIPPKDNAPALPVPPAAAVASAPAAASATAATPAKAGAQSPEPPKVAEVAPAQSAAPDAKLATPKAPPAKVAAVKAEAKGAEPPKTSPAAAPKLEGFAVQVGAFRDEAKLTQARQKLATAGVVHYTERLDSPAGPLTRLRAGPFPTREQAEGALASLKRASLDGKVVALP